MTTPYRTLQALEERLVYTVAQAGDVLGIPRAFAYELVARGELPVIRLGRRLLVPKVGPLALVGQAEPEASPDSHVRPRSCPSAGEPTFSDRGLFHGPEPHRQEATLGELNGRDDRAPTR